MEKLNEELYYAQAMGCIEAKDWMRARTVADTRLDAMFNAITNPRKMVGRVLAVYFYKKFVHNDVWDVLIDNKLLRLGYIDEQTARDIKNATLEDIYPWTESEATTYKTFENLIREKRNAEAARSTRGRGFFAENLTEARKNLINPHIGNLVDSCIQDLKDFGIMPFDWGDDIDVEETDSVHTFGSMRFQKASGGNFTLSLSKHLFNEPDKNIKNTIYHELCHYIQYKQWIEEGIVYWDGIKLKCTPEYRTWEESSHGGRWQRIANDVSRLTGSKITRTNNYEFHNEVGKVAEKRYKYIFHCKKCSSQFKYMKETDFVKDVLSGNGHSTHYWCHCGSHDFDIERKG